MTETTTTARDETPIFFSAGDETLFGVLTTPNDPNGMGFLLLSGGMWNASPGRNRVYTKLARQLGGRGFATLRFDYRGTGESSGLIERFRIEDPLVEDAVAAAKVLLDAGASPLISAGLCFGARTALASAEHIPALRGMALYAPPIRDFEIGQQFTSKPLSWWIRRGARWRTMRGLFTRERRAVYVKLVRRKLRLARRRDVPVDREARQVISPLLQQQLASAVKRDVRVLMVFGEQDECYADFLHAKTRSLGPVLEQAGDRISVVVVPGKVHGLVASDAQRDVIAATLAWLPSVVS